MKKIKQLRFVLVFLFPLAFILSQCFHKTASTDPRGEQYAGSASCMKCHKNIADNYLHSAHFRTSRLATQATISGSFLPDSNTVAFNDSIKVVMEKHADGLYQASYTHGKLTQQHRFDIIFGSKRAETYFFWKDNEAHELPMTYYKSLHKWANSPGGYYGDSVNFSRVIATRCFECHSSYVKNLPDTTGNGYKTTLYDKSSMILGVDCERCHGPGAEHVNFQTENPAEKQAKYMVKISALTRARRMDLCSVCHAGNSYVMTRPTFDFKPGDTLSNYINGASTHRFIDVTKMDVHGNQVKLLTSSKCFISSKIECATCHTVHDSGVKSVLAWSQHCTTCHSEANHNFCKMANAIGPAITTNCVDCHMPVKSSQTIVINGAGKPSTPPFLARTHLIAIYPEETKKIMEMLKKR
jgi:hypothetical protein